ncbi:transglutaminase family protein [Nitratireductor sp. ZSWI3]|uniref:transglutaminase family protein n=1 Tax=Nitratireductor sp. ZSWI3 TaxID=2966359 RepID=UPI00214FD559|nr:transglutaminase family protein [Nitratireductor sp. ZSWI3]MCR4268951.1 transglutaminase family protein [Nitratireductor sp. ZSWI3]
MRLKISHRTEYRYDAPVSYALQRLRLVPRNGPTQEVVEWSLTTNGAHDEVHFIDGFGNDTRLISIAGTAHTMLIEARGVIDTRNTAGVTGRHEGLAPLWLFQQQTRLCTAGRGIAALLKAIKGDDDVERLHGLMHEVRARVAYTVGTTHAATTAEEALAKGEGVCQDHAHIFLTAARAMGFSARYVSGYLRMDDTDEQAASHAWAEAHLEGLGWVSFDCSNGISADERYARVATGRDYRDAMPVMGIRLGHAQEELAVQITVEQ